MERDLEAYHKASNVKAPKDKERLSLKYDDLKSEYKQLLEAFERSEKIRREQKELIQGMKKDLLKIRFGGGGKVADKLNVQFQEETKEGDHSRGRDSLSPAPIISLEVITGGKNSGFKKVKKTTALRSRSKDSSSSEPKK